MPQRGQRQVDERLRHSDTSLENFGTNLVDVSTICLVEPNDHIDQPNRHSNPDESPKPRMVLAKCAKGGMRIPTHNSVLRLLLRMQLRLLNPRK
jgi:hypothetical protein